MSQTSSPTVFHDVVQYSSTPVVRLQSTTEYAYFGFPFSAFCLLANGALPVVLRYLVIASSTPVL